MSTLTLLINELRSSRLFLQLKWRVLRLPITRWSLLLLAIPLLILLPSLDLFPYPNSDSQFSDLTISHFPNAWFFKESLFTNQQVPLWSPTILSGFPFAANPLSGLWYPPGWLVLFTPLPFGFNLLVGFHLIWGGLGLYLLMKEEGLRHTASLFSSLSFALLPKFFSHYGAGHVTLLYAIPWMPWLLWSHKVHTNPREEIRKILVPPGLILGMIMLADVRWGAFALILWWSYSIFHRPGKWRKLILDLAVQSVLGLLIAAPILVPLVEYSLLSTRSMLGAEDVLIYSLPIENFLGLLFPNNEGLHEWVLYSGGIVILLAAASMTAKMSRNRLFWMGIFLVSVIIALGSEIPGSSFVASLPLVSLFRVPSRALFLTGFSLAALAGYGIETLISLPRNDITRKINIILIILLGFSISLLIGFFIFQGEILQPMVWGTTGILLASIWIWLWLKVKQMPVGLWVSGLFVLALLDLGVVDLNSFQAKSKSQVLVEGEAVAEYLSLQPGLFRTYSPSYSVPQQTSVRYGIQTTDGIDPLQYLNYVKFMDEATGVPRERYSVTLPPYADGEPKSDNLNYTPNAEKLGLLNVGYVVSEYEINARDLNLVAEIQDSFVYENMRFMPRAWMSGETGVIDNASSVEIIESSPNHMVFAATGPGSLTISEIYYPGWKVKVDGVDEQLSTRYGLLMGVDLSPGRHEVELFFRPLSVVFGVIFFLIGLISLVLMIKRDYPN